MVRSMSAQHWKWQERAAERTPQFHLNISADWRAQPDPLIYMSEIRHERTNASEYNRPRDGKDTQQRPNIAPSWSSPEPAPSSSSHLPASPWHRRHQGPPPSLIRCYQSAPAHPDQCVGLVLYRSPLEHKRHAGLWRARTDGWVARVERLGFRGCTCGIVEQI
ncbi:hypothetical protein OE88DRAFT_1041592 [Heliocybe sulcata]|uniref:Uncharacterized protein n=1 Tax=Heliocybe sulcata TaxID=5364 RepID=A0A5C3MP87_9AGAM|nr:hypothetical protein OE88DRAFT_1041592 [Heliocybe sulcata]